MSHFSNLTFLHFYYLQGQINGLAKFQSFKLKSIGDMALDSTTSKQLDCTMTNEKKIYRRFNKRL